MLAVDLVELVSVPLGGSNFKSAVRDSLGETEKIKHVRQLLSRDRSKQG